MGRTNKNTKVNREALEQAIGESDTYNRKITIYSKPAAAVLRYMDLTIPLFSKAGAATEILQKVINKKYPEEWKAVVAQNIPAVRPLSKSYWPGKLEIKDKAAWAQATEEVSTRKGRIITIYSPRMAAVIRYIANTTPRFSMSKSSAEMLEKGIEERFPELWAQLLEALKE